MPAYTPRSFRPFGPNYDETLESWIFTKTNYEIALFAEVDYEIALFAHLELEVPAGQFYSKSTFKVLFEIFLKS